MLFNTNNKHVQDATSGEMTSQPMYTNGTNCMEFWYNMPNSMATLELYLIQRGGSRQRIWTGKGPTNGWSKANIQIQVSGSFQASYNHIQLRYFYCMYTTANAITAVCILQLSF